MTINNPIQSQNDMTMEIVNSIISDQPARRQITRESHYWFFHLYFSQYVKFQTADYQKELFAISEDESNKMAIIVAFRGSAKSTIMTMSYPIWAILGKQQKKCIVILSQTQQLVKTHFANIKRELESNELLKSDLGPFQEESDEWGSYSIVIPRFNAKIIAASSEQTIRGMRHGAYRPDLIICDDVEDLNSTKTREGRDKTYNWFTGEIMPSGDKNTKVIVIGNLLHEDSLLMRLKDHINANKLKGIFREYPLIDADENISWPGKFPSLVDIQEFKNSIPDEKAWQREFLLKIIADADQVIKPEWIQYYDELPTEKNYYRYTSMGVDLAISEKESADYTAMVIGKVYGYEETMRIYILPMIVNERIDFPTTVERVKEIANTIIDRGNFESKIYVENVAYQKALEQTLDQMNYNVEGISVSGQDKRSRLSLVSHLIKSGKVLFPRNSSEYLINQIVYFGVEKHDDLCDALTLLLAQAIANDRAPIQIMPRFF